jgi:anaerobic ribonucleoside-triphosphate reductase activating protein
MNENTSPNKAPASAAERSPHQLKVGGVTPFTATDYPGALAAVVFVQGCPWHCGYCHNPHLRPRLSNTVREWDDVLRFLRSRVGLIDAVVFSGGEPTIDPALMNAVADVRALGFKVGLHTACIYPQRLATLLPVLDWVGFDVKAPFAHYRKVTGIADSGRQVRACIEAILASGIRYECRTTIHPALLDESDLLALAHTLAEIGVRRYVLQQYRAQGCNHGENDGLNNGLNNGLDAGIVPGYPAEQTVQQIAALFDDFSFRRDYK